MFSRSQRISSALFDEALQKGASLKSPHFSLAVLKGERLNQQLRPKIAVVVSRKVAGKATERNRLRRQARAWVKGYVAQVNLPAGTVLVVFVNAAWQGAFPAALALELAKLLSSIAK